MYKNNKTCWNLLPKLQHWFSCANPVFTTKQSTQSLIKGIKLTAGSLCLIRCTATALSQSPGAAAWLICPVPRAVTIVKLSTMQRLALSNQLELRWQHVQWVSGCADWYIVEIWLLRASWLTLMCYYKVTRQENILDVGGVFLSYRWDVK